MNMLLRKVTVMKRSLNDVYLETNAIYVSKSLLKNHCLFLYCCINHKKVLQYSGNLPTFWVSVIVLFEVRQFELTNQCDIMYDGKSTHSINYCLKYNLCWIKSLVLVLHGFAWYLRVKKKVKSNIRICIEIYDQR